MSAPNSDRNMQQLVPIAPPGKAYNGESGKELVVVDPAGKSSGSVKLREDEEDLEVKAQAHHGMSLCVSATHQGPLLALALVISTRYNSGDFPLRSGFDEKFPCFVCGVRISANTLALKTYSAHFLLQYRQMRREQDRIARMDADYQKREAMPEFELRREERLKAAEERTAKKRLKRQKKKQHKKEKRAKTGNNGGEEPNRVESSDDDKGSDDDDESKQ
ncbi:unnamed protein product [Miscanthus lutarioriparius]|uniref:Uncharacterized protein n=1 Tax=Miscanthus lutarioriparius TaxID=422564 RepID=A0A811RF62_9POAL|nr:unnamed protein product [Miscanthus lutarioriparius]